MPPNVLYDKNSNNVKTTEFQDKQNRRSIHFGRVRDHQLMLMICHLLFDIHTYLITPYEILSTKESSSLVCQSDDRIYL